MSATRGLLIGIIVIIILVAIGIFASRRTGTALINPSEPPLGTLAPDVIPSTSPITGVVQGMIVAVAKDPNSGNTVVTVRQGTTDTNLILTPQTRVVSDKNLPLALASLKSGLQILASGVPVQNGFEVTEIIITTASPSPSPRVSATPRAILPAPTGTPMVTPY